MGEWGREQQKAWRKQLFDVQNVDRGESGAMVLKGSCALKSSQNVRPLKIALIFLPFFFFSMFLFFFFLPFFSVSLFYLLFLLSKV